MQLQENWYDPDAQPGERGYADRDLHISHQQAYEAQEKARREKLRENSCFIATSAFEGTDHPTVQALRDYRDEVLAYHPAGRMFTKIYYGGLGQAGAHALDAVPILKPAVRAGLEAFARNFIEPSLERRGYKTAENLV